MAAQVGRYNGDRQIWLFDSWEGMPEPTAEDVLPDGRPGTKGMALGYEERVRELLFKKLKVESTRVRLVKGWFKDTIPAYKRDIGEMAFLHVDCDWYESVGLCLEELFDGVISGGFVVIDDYGSFKGCRKAFDEFAAKRGLRVGLVPIDETAVYMRK